MFRPKPHFLIDENETMVCERERRGPSIFAITFQPPAGKDGYGLDPHQPDRARYARTCGGWRGISRTYPHRDGLVRKEREFVMQELFSVATNDHNLEGLSVDRRFDANWRKVSRIIECDIADLDGFVKAHYLGKRPGAPVFCLKMLTLDLPVGMVIYAIPPPETEKRYGGKTWELARLYILDRIPKNAETWLIGASVRFIKRFRKDVRHLVSYADPSAGHAGGIYKASNWIEDGKTDDERETPRFDLVDAITGKKYGRASHVPMGAQTVRQARVSKHRFVMHL